MMKEEIGEVFLVRCTENNNLVLANKNLSVDNEPYWLTDNPSDADIFQIEDIAEDFAEDVMIASGKDCEVETWVIMPKDQYELMKQKIKDLS